MTSSRSSPSSRRSSWSPYLKAARFYNDALKDGRFAGPNAAEVIAILAADSNVKDPALYKKMTPNGIHPDGKINEASLARDYQFYKDQKYVDGSVKMEQVVDTSFVNAALKALGPYQPKQ